MRLIDVNTLQFHEFYGSQLEDVSYAILSHTWHDEEVSYQEMKNERGQAESKEGYTKILFTATQAKKDGLDWVWVDTCCIDKTSSAELTEAINSMYRWYERSAVCYAYLQDVDSTPLVEDDDAQFKRSRWFTRGWTLQELLAPARVIFYSQDWKQVGEKLTCLLSSAHPVDRIWGEKGKRALCVASGLPHELLFGERSKDYYSVAERMSWASKRVCTRIEDVAYCLLGLFDINMPLLYGEEERAFIRLQEEIIRTIDDHSIYAWTIPKDYYYWHNTTRASTTAQHNNINWSFHPMLAPSPRLFEHGGGVICTAPESHEPSGPTKHGVRIQLDLNPYPFPILGHVLDHPHHNVFLAVLNCCHLHHSIRSTVLDKPLDRIAVVLFLAQPNCPTIETKSYGTKVSHFYRVATSKHLVVVGRSEDKSVISYPIYIKQKLPESDIAATRSKFIFQFSGIPVLLFGVGVRLPQHEIRQYVSNSRSASSAPALGCRVATADPQTCRDWSYTLNCLGSSPPPGVFDRPRAFIIANDMGEAIILVCQVATIGITASSLTAATITPDSLPRAPSPVLVASVTKLSRMVNHESAAREACESALINPGPNSHTYTEFPCWLPEVKFEDGTIKMGVSIVEVKPPKDQSWNGGRRLSFTFTVSEEKTNI